MKALTMAAVLLCDHLGRVQLTHAQSFVNVSSQKVLVQHDPESRPIALCPNVGPTIKPCTSSLVAETGYSSFVKISGRAVAMDTITGLTDGTPPGIVKYKVVSPGQNFVNIAE